MFNSLAKLLGKPATMKLHHYDYNPAVAPPVIPNNPPPFPTHGKNHRARLRRTGKKQLRHGKAGRK